MLKTHELKTIQLNDPNDFKKILLNNQPVKVKGLIKDWKASNWDMDYFKSALGDGLVKVLTNLPVKSGGMLMGGQNRYEEEMKFNKFVELIFDTNAKPCYLGYAPIDSIVNSTTDYNFNVLTPNTDAPTG